MEDKQIVDLFWQRSEAAIVAAASKYGKYCSKIAYNILQNYEDSEECVNDTYLKAWGAIPTHRPTRLSTFLGKITRNLALNKWEYLNAEKRGSGQISFVLEELQECVPDVDNTEKIADDLALIEVLNHFLAGLPKEQRIIFLRRYWYLCSVKEIAANHSITVNVKFKDGSIAEKKLLIQPTYDDSIRELCISVLSEDTEALAEKYLQSAFSFDAKECSPIITQEDDMLSFQYLKDEDDSFTVDFYKGYDFPQTLYHFCHSNEEEQVFIEKNEDFQFNTEMVETAKAFVKKVYGIDCSEADVHAYGYANKVSVQLNVAANVIFQVRFYYKDDVPVGVLFFTEQEYATGAMKANKAALLYSDTAH